MQEVQVMPVGSIEATSRAEIDVQVRTAKMYPRDIERAKSSTTALALADSETAASMAYHLKRGGKTVSGGSVRLAEIIASQWGNLRVSTRVVEVGDAHVSVEGLAHDLETNVAYRNEVRRRIQDRNGNRYNEDMITTTINAASAIAKREAIFNAIPKAYWQPIYNASLSKAQETGKSLAETRKNMVAAFESIGVSKKTLLDSLEIDSVEKITAKHIGELRTIYASIESGETQIESHFQNFNKATERERAKFWSDIEAEDLNEWIPGEQRDEVKSATKERLDEIVELAKAARELDEHDKKEAQS